MDADDLDFGHHRDALDPDAVQITANQIALATLKPSESPKECPPDEWILSPIAPLEFGPVCFKAREQQDGIRSAQIWLQIHLRNERPELVLELLFA